MTELSDKLNEARGGGHHIPPAVEEALLSLEGRVDALEGKKEPEKKAKPFLTDPEPPNPMDGARIDN